MYHPDRDNDHKLPEGNRPAPEPGSEKVTDDLDAFPVTAAELDAVEAFLMPALRDLLAGKAEPGQQMDSMSKQDEVYSKRRR